MSTLQSPHQYRQTHWSLEVGEEGGSVTLKRTEGRQAKKRKYTTYDLKCKGCKNGFRCNAKDQPYCSHQCFVKHKSKTASMIPCMVCLQGLGYGIKAIGRKMAMRHVIVRMTMMRAGVYNPRGSSKIASNRESLSNRSTASDRSPKSYISRSNRIGPTRSLTPIQKMRRLLRNQIHRMLLHIRTKREIRTEQYVGCSFEEAKQRIESQFTRGMTWQNCGSFWHLDHIVPLSSFDLNNPKERMLANHISNLRPLRAKENLKKGNKIPIAHQFDLIAN